MVKVAKKSYDTRKTRKTNYIKWLPNEILLRIFQYLKPIELWTSVRPVCRRWEIVSKSPFLWQSIDAPENLPTDILQKWIEFSSNLKRVKLINRRDANVIIRQLSKRNKKLESVEALNCWGSSTSPVVNSGALCKLLERCPNLSNINLSGTKFYSCKFYRLIAQFNHIHAVHHKKKKLPVTKPHALRYFGRASVRQIRTFLLARQDAAQDYLALLHFQADGINNNHGDVSWEPPSQNDGQQVEREPESVDQPDADDELVLVDRNDVNELINYVDREGANVVNDQNNGNYVEFRIENNAIDLMLDYIGLSP